MTGIELAVGYLFAWVLRKGKRVAGRADAEVDRTLDTAMDRFHDLVSSKLGEDPALKKLTEEAEGGQEQPSDRSRRRVHDSLEDAAEQDPGFAEALERAVRELEALARPAGAAPVGEHGVHVGGNVDIRADRGSIAGWQVTLGNNVTLGNPQLPGSPQG